MKERVGPVGSEEERGGEEDGAGWDRREHARRGKGGEGGRGGGERRGALCIAVGAMRLALERGGWCGGGAGVGRGGATSLASLARSSNI